MLVIIWQQSNSYQARRAHPNVIFELSVVNCKPARNRPDPNRRLSDVLGARRMNLIERDEPSLLRGQYRIVLVRKPLAEAFESNEISADESEQ